jgi:hypothetical protein
MEPKEYPTIHHTELQPFRPGDALAVEWEVYRREVGRFLAEGYEGKHVLIKGEEIVGFFDTRIAALDVAYERFLGQPFLVHQVQTRERLIRCNWMWRPRRCPTPPGP